MQLPELQQLQAAIIAAWQAEPDKGSYDAAARQEAAQFAVSVRLLLNACIHLVAHPIVWHVSLAPVQAITHNT